MLLQPHQDRLILTSSKIIKWIYQQKMYKTNLFPILQNYT